MPCVTPWLTSGSVTSATVLPAWRPTVAMNTRTVWFCRPDAVLMYGSVATVSPPDDHQSGKPIVYGWVVPSV